jgi:hypothetical protein
MKSLLVSVVGLALLLPSAALAQSENDPGFDGFQPENAPPPGPVGELDELPAEEQPASEVDYQTFHDALSPYGNWVYTTDYGWVWTPAGVDQDWRPYSDGQWLWTSYGWTWSGSEAWAWAPYHYGRWCYLNDIGWGWVPGFTWGPAWVSWRVGGDFVGWTALYPGYPYGGPWLGTYPIYYNQWCFTGYGNFWGAPVSGNLYPTPYVQSNVWGHTHAVVPVQSGGVVYNGPSHSVVAAAVGHPITPVAIHPVAAASQAGFHANANTMNVYAPRFQAAAHPFATRHGGISQSVSAQQPRGVGSLVRQAAVAPMAQAKVARAPMAPAPSGAHHAPAPAGVQPSRGNAPTAPHGTPGGGGATRPAGQH